VPKAYAYRINNQGKHKIKMPKEIKKILKAPNKNQEEAERTDEVKRGLWRLAGPPSVLIYSLSLRNSFIHAEFPSRAELRSIMSIFIEINSY